MNPSKPASTPAEKLTRARLILLSLGLPSAVAYARRHLSKVDQLELAQVIKQAHGTSAAATSMRFMQFSIEAALHELCGAQAVERYEYMAAWAAV